MVALLFGISTALCSLTQSLPLMILYMGFIGCLEGIFWVNLPLFVIEVFSGEHTDYAYALLVSVSSLGYLAGPPAMGNYLLFFILKNYKIGYLRVEQISDLSTMFTE